MARNVAHIAHKGDDMATKVKGQGQEPAILDPEAEELAQLAPVVRLGADLRQAARELSSAQARYLVDFYYQIQEYRLRAASQQHAAAVQEEPNLFIGWTFRMMSSTEGAVKTALDAYTNTLPLGQWMKSITGIGPVISAGFLANLEQTPPATVGAWWRFAGLDPTVKWLSREKAKVLVKEVCDEKGVTGSRLDAEIVAVIAVRANRNSTRFLSAAIDDHGGYTRSKIESMLAKRPWNATLKVLCWKLGESFVKFQNNPKDFYGKVFASRKAWEAEQNERHAYADQAAEWVQRVGKDTQAYGYYERGLLPPGHLHARAKRYAVKLFISHFHTVAYWLHFHRLPVLPYVIDVLGHADLILPPHADMFDGLPQALDQWMAQRPQVKDYAHLKPWKSNHQAGGLDDTV